MQHRPGGPGEGMCTMDRMSSKGTPPIARHRDATTEHHLDVARVSPPWATKTMQHRPGEPGDGIDPVDILSSTGMPPFAQTTEQREEGGRNGCSVRAVSPSPRTHKQNEEVYYEYGTGTVTTEWKSRFVGVDPTVNWGDTPRFSMAGRAIPIKLLATDEGEAVLEILLRGGMPVLSDPAESEDGGKGAQPHSVDASQVDESDGRLSPSQTPSGEGKGISPCDWDAVVSPTKEGRRTPQENQGDALRLPPPSDQEKMKSNGGAPSVGGAVGGATRPPTNAQFKLAGRWQGSTHTRPCQCVIGWCGKGQMPNPPGQGWDPVSSIEGPPHPRGGGP